MKAKYKIGDTVQLSADGKENENYEAYAEATMRITHVATRYMASKEFFDKGKPNGYHPGFDTEARSPLYDLETIDGKHVPFSLYEWELRSA